MTQEQVDLFITGLFFFMLGAAVMGAYVLATGYRHKSLDITRRKP